MKKPARWDVVVVGGANFDYTARGHALPTPGQTLEADSVEHAVGGKGVNQAAAAARLGARVAFVGRVGKDSRGDDVIDALEAEGINVDFLSRDGREPTGMSLTMAGQDGRKQTMTAPGANRRLTEHDVDEARPVLESAKIVLSQLEVPDAAALRAAGIAKEAGALFLLDPAPVRPLPEGLLGLCDLIKPDAEEAYALTGIRCHEELSAAEAARRLVSRGARAACVQADGKGRFLVSPRGQHWLHPLETTADLGAAGDAFIGAMAAALAEGQRWDEAARFAHVASALETRPTPTTAGLPRRAAVLRLLSERYSALSGG